MTIADSFLDFYENLHFEGTLPDQIDIMNPFRDSFEIRKLCELFYRKFYSDSENRTLILGINPGRLGAGATGIPFTDTKRLNDDCGIVYNGFSTHEPSSVFIYEMINSYGGPKLFYENFYINSVCPLGFVKRTCTKLINYNYYDSIELEVAVRPFIIENIHKQIAICGKSEICYCLGSGKNYLYLKKLNHEFNFFKNIIPLEHPRFIMQYKNKGKDGYIAEYLEKLKG